MTPTLADRFWSKVQRGSADACWPWTKGTNNRGYGQFRIYSNGSARNVLAHRLALELSSGEPIAEGLLALHSCDNPPCCNPAHLRAGTYKENSADAKARGRLRQGGLRGSALPQAVLTEDDIPEIRRQLRLGKKQRDIAAKFGVDQRVITLINRRKAWNHVPDPGADLNRPVRVRELQPCGTSAAYQQHRKRGEEACRACKAARAAEVRQQKAARASMVCLADHAPTLATTGAAL